MIATQAQVVMAATALWFTVMLVNAGMWIMVAWALGTERGRRAAVVWNMVTAVVLSVGILLTVRRWL